MTIISIIMPVYNGVEYLKDSIESVLNQTFEDFELICVNDSSKDNSEEILREYSNRDSRVKFFTKENAGPGMALNYGIEKSSGKYLCFLDQDDKYCKDYLSKMYEQIEKYKTDLCVCNAYLWIEGEELRKIYPEKKSGVVDISSYKKKKFISFNHAPQWTKMVLKEFWVNSNIKFPDRKNKAHDIPVHYKVIGLVDKIAYIDEPLYYHRSHYGQISASIDGPESLLISAQDVLAWVSESDFTKRQKRNIKSFAKGMLCKASIGAKGVEVYEKTIELIDKNYSFVDKLFLKIKATRKFKRRQRKILKLKVPKIKNVGDCTYCASYPIIVNPNTKIGKFCSLGGNIKIGHGNHPTNYLSTNPYLYFDDLGWKSAETPSHNEYWLYPPVNIGNDVWIGDDVSIKNGITIGDGAIIGMGAVVTKYVEPYSIVAGVPAKHIRYRFSEDIIKKLLELKWWDLDAEIIKKIPYDNIDKAIEYLERVRNEFVSRNN